MTATQTNPAASASRLRWRSIAMGATALAVFMSPGFAANAAAPDGDAQVKAEIGAGNLQERASQPNVIDSLSELTAAVQADGTVKTQRVSFKNRDINMA